MEPEIVCYTISGKLLCYSKGWQEVTVGRGIGGREGVREREAGWEEGQNRPM